jgi:hypothetical protein
MCFAGFLAVAFEASANNNSDRLLGYLRPDVFPFTPVRPLASSLPLYNVRLASGRRPCHSIGGTAWAHCIWGRHCRADLVSIAVSARCFALPHCNPAWHLGLRERGDRFANSHCNAPLPFSAQPHLHQPHLRRCLGNGGASCRSPSAASASAPQSGGYEIFHIFSQLRPLIASGQSAADQSAHKGRSGPRREGGGRSDETNAEMVGQCHARLDLGVKRARHRPRC